VSLSESVPTRRTSRAATLAFLQRKFSLPLQWSRVCHPQQSIIGPRASVHPCIRASAHPRIRASVHPRETRGPRVRVSLAPCRRRLGPLPLPRRSATTGSHRTEVGRQLRLASCVPGATTTTTW
jgi:hypothetical protein